MMAREQASDTGEMVKLQAPQGLVKSLVLILVGALVTGGGSLAFRQIEKPAVEAEARADAGDRQERLTALEKSNANLAREIAELTGAVNALRTTIEAEAKATERELNDHDDRVTRLERASRDRNGLGR